MAGNTASQLSDFYSTYGGESAFTQEYRDVIETMLYAEDDIDNGDYASAGTRLAAIWQQYPIGDPSWWTISDNNDAINSDLPTAYAAYRMLQQIVDDAALITSTVPESATITVLLPHCSEGPVPSTLAELQNGTGTVEQRSLDPRVQADDYAVLRNSISLYQHYFLAVTDGRLELNLEFVELPNVCMQFGPQQVTSPSDPRIEIRPDHQARTDVWNALSPEHQDSDAYWLLGPSMIPETHNDPGSDFQNVAFLNGGITAYPTSAPLLISDDSWFLEKQVGLGSGDYTDVERRVYFPHWMQHEFFHYFFWEYPEFELEAASHQWFDASTWPSDFADFGSQVKESDYYTEALNRRFKTAEVHPAVQFRKSPVAPPSTALFESLTIDDLVGRYQQVSPPASNAWHWGVIEHAGSGYQWRNDANVSWGVTDEQLTSGLLTTDGSVYPVEVSHHIVLKQDSNGQYTSEVAGFEFNGGFYMRFDESLPLHDFTASTFTAAEGNATNTTHVVTVTRSGNTDVASTIDVELHGWTARPEDDFTPGPIAVSFLGGETEKSVPIELWGDTSVERDERLSLTFVSGSGGQVGLTTTNAVVTIENDDAYYDFSASSFSAPEGDSANSTNVVTVTRSGTTDVASSVDVVLNDLTAMAGDDFTPGPITVSFAANETTKSVPIELLGDTTVELDEAIGLSFDGGEAGATQSTSVLTIVDGDSATISIGDASVVEGANLVFDVTLSAPVDEDTVVTYSTSDGTATIADNDYTGQTEQTVTIPAGLTTAQITVATIGDIQAEPDEDLTVSVSSVRNGAPTGLLAYYNFDGQSENQFGPAPDAILVGPATIGSAGSGYTGTGADAAMNLGTAIVATGTHFDSAYNNDSIAVSFWQYTNQFAWSSSFWIDSPDDEHKRGFQAHVPGADGTIYFDHSGCCGPEQRLVTSGAVTGEWQHFVFQKDAAGTKQIWINGIQISQSVGGVPLLPFDGVMRIGSGIDARIDEFAVWDSAITPAAVGQLAGGAPTLSIANRNIVLGDAQGLGTILNQSDADGVDDSVENVVDYGGAVGDGNDDGIQDSDQSNVASLPTVGQDAPYITIVVPDTVGITNVATQALPVPASVVPPPIDVIFPLGFVQFDTPPAPATESTATQVEIFFDPDQAFDTFYKFGPTADNSVPHYYEFTFDPVTGTGAEFFPGRVVLHLKDGERGDADGTVNGVISDSGALAVTEIAPPAIESVVVGSSKWDPAFIAEMNSHPLGFAIPKGETQLRTLPWDNIDRIRVTFTKEVGIELSDIMLNGVVVSDYGPSQVTFDSKTNTATIVLDSPIGVDALNLVVKDSVTDQMNNALDGDWTNGLSSNVSGDGTAGGSFIYSFRVLPGDINGSGVVAINDVGPVRTGLGKSAGEEGYSIFADLNGSGSISVDDVQPIRMNLGRPAEPVPSDVVAAIPKSRVRNINPFDVIFALDKDEKNHPFWLSD